MKHFIHMLICLTCLNFMACSNTVEEENNKKEIVSAESSLPQVEDSKQEGQNENDTIEREVEKVNKEIVEEEKGFEASLKDPAVTAQNTQQEDKKTNPNTITVIGPGIERQKVEEYKDSLTTVVGATKTKDNEATAPRVPEILGTVDGKVKFEGDDTIQGGIVSFFKADGSPTPDQASARKVPYKISKMNTDGTFSVKLPAGPYHMGAMKWKKGRRPGPPMPGEEFIFIYDKGKILRRIDCKAGEINDVGELSGWSPEEKERDLTHSLIIRGTVTNEKAEPFSGAVVMLKVEINSEKPQFISNPTKEDGRYEFVVLPGTYFLIAKQGSYMVGRPRPGSYMGAYGQKEAIGAGGGGGRTQASASTVWGEKGETLENIDIVMFVLPDPEELKKTTRERVGAQEIGKPEVPVQINQ